MGVVCALCREAPGISAVEVVLSKENSACGSTGGGVLVAPPPAVLFLEERLELVLKGEAAGVVAGVVVVLIGTFGLE